MQKQHVKRIKEKKHTNTLIHAEKVFAKIQYPFMVKQKQNKTKQTKKKKTKTRRKFPHILRSYMKNPELMSYYGERLKTP